MHFFKDAWPIFSVHLVWAECIPVFGSHMKKPKVSTVANTIEVTTHATSELKKTHS